MEIQVRTSFQQLWAEASEKLSDFLGSAIKYGGGAHETQAELLTLSNAIAKFEGAEYRLLDAKRKLDVWLSGAALTEEEHAAIIMKQQELNSIEAQLRAMRADILDDFRQAIDNLQE